MRTSSLTTEDAIALRLASSEVGYLRYCHDAQAWFVWERGVWRRDRAGRVVYKIRQAMREVAEVLAGNAPAGQGSMRFVGAVERLARSDPGLAVTAADWDCTALRLGTPGGTIRLATGELTEADPDDGLTRTTAVTPAGSAACPTFSARLDALAGGSRELVGFLQQAFGAALAGGAGERVIVHIEDPHGAGAAALVPAIAEILGDYARPMTLAGLAATSPAALICTRLVTVHAPEGRAWPPAIPELFATSGRIALGERTAVPTARLVTYGAGPPDVRRFDKAARRCLRVLRCGDAAPQTGSPDVELIEREGPGLLRWLIDGCGDWLAQGLAWPPGVETATKQALAGRSGRGHDALGRFLEEMCECAPGDVGHMAPAGTLFAAWSVYAQMVGQRAGSPRTFAEALQARGFVRDRTATGRSFRGLSLRPLVDDEVGMTA